MATHSSQGKFSVSDPDNLSLKHRVFRYVFLSLAKITRGMTLGVRAVVLDGENRVFLVRHTYVPGWSLPGGGVEVGETFVTSLARELEEEGNIVLEGEPQLHGIFFNIGGRRRDHVAIYVVRAFRQTAPRPGDVEIAETGFFALDALPVDTTRATRQRLAEVLEGAPITAHW